MRNIEGFVIKIGDNEQFACACCKGDVRRKPNSFDSRYAFVANEQDKSIFCSIRCLNMHNWIAEGKKVIQKDQPQVQAISS